MHFTSKSLVNLALPYFDIRLKLQLTLDKNLALIQGQYTKSDQ